jgi:hypothetical protein
VDRGLAGRPGELGGLASHQRRDVEKVSLGSTHGTYPTTSG